MVGVRVEGLTFAYGRHRVLNNISVELDVPVTAIVGPNAAGKTTLLKCLAGIIVPRGRILFDGVPISTLGRKKLARMVGYLAQEATPDSTLTVLEYVLLGRLAHLTWRVGDADLDAALAVIERLNIGYLATRLVAELSGGQRQLVSAAQVLAQEPALLLMDEPTNNLDLRHQLQVLEMVAGLCRQGTLAAVLALHDLNLAARFADKIIVLSRGEIYSYGPSACVLTEAMLRSIYGVHADVTLDGDNIPQITPRRAVRSCETF